jgi:hypothetical protein
MVSIKLTGIKYLLINNLKTNKMALSTTNLASEGGSGLPKTISPGNYTLKLNSLSLEDFKFIPGAKHLVMNVETEPIDGFEGFMIDKDNPEAGHHAGQIGRVKASQYAFADGQTKSGVKVERDKSLMIFLKNLTTALGAQDWFLSQDNKHDTIEEFIDAFNNERPFENTYLEFCIAGKEYEGKSGYTNYDMWLPKGSKGVYSFSPKGGSVMEFNESEHLKKMEAKPVESFGDDDFEVPSRAASDFNLD